MKRAQIDWKLIIPALSLLIMGLLIIRSAAPSLVTNQILFAVVSFAIFLVLSNIDFRVFTSLYLPVYFIAIILLVSPLVFGFHSRGALRWIQIGQYTLQPSEIVKPLLLVVFSVLSASSFKFRNWLLILSAAIPLSIIFYQPDLGTTLVLLTGWMTIFFSKIRLKYILPILLLISAAAFPVYHFALHDYQRQRLDSFFNPYSDPLGQGYHVIQSIIAVGSGEFFGRGLGHGTQSQLQFLPEHHTDFIFASLSEELGFVGSVLVLAMFLLLLFRIYQISQSTPSATASSFCLATVALLAFQIFVNIGMNMGLAPITGITLPFISYGGSSLLSLGINLGMIHSISKHLNQDPYIQIG